MAQESTSYWDLIRNGLIAENTTFKLALSLCPAIAVTSSLRNGVLMGVAVLFVQVMVNMTISSMRKIIHPRIRLPIFMLVISGWVTITDMSMVAFAPDAYKQMGLYIQLIVAFASILARAEMFASKNTIAPSDLWVQQKVQVAWPEPLALWRLAPASEVWRSELSLLAMWPAGVALLVLMLRLLVMLELVVLPGRPE